MSELKSIWDGWTKQAFFMFGGHDDGPRCAEGFLYFEHGLSLRTYLEDGTYKRIADYIRSHYELPVDDVDVITPFGWNQHLCMSLDNEVVVYANNVLKLTPEQFREIDRASQIQSAMPQIDALIESAVKEEVHV